VHVLRQIGIAERRRVSPATVAVCALVAAIVVSCTSRINVGVIAIPLAWAVGLYAGLGAETVLGGFPGSLFVTLAGVTLLFGLAEANGTIHLLVQQMMGLARGRNHLVPVLLFLIAGTIATLGPGAIVAVALVAPIATALGRRAGIPAFLTALMVTNGANAGNLSPLSAVGIIAGNRMAAAGLGIHPGKVFAANFLAHVAVGAGAYLLLIRHATPAPEADSAGAARSMSGSQKLTIAIVAVWIAAVVGVRAPIGLAAFAAAAAIIVLGLGDEAAAFKRVPWSAIVMVCGMTMLVVMVEKTGGMDVFTALLARLARPDTLNGVIAFVTGVISTYSSTSAVVLPTFLPIVPRLVQQVGGGDPLAVALSINVGASLVDVSPLSTLGALCVAAVAEPDEARALFRKLMVWGLSMAIVGALLCQLFAGPFARL
jgi:di/tricarboxylate transporter